MHSRVKPASKYDSGCRDSDEAKGKCFGGAARITQAINDVKAANAVDPDQGTLVVDAGDQMMGSLWSTYYRGQAACEIQKVMGIQAMAVGNHEFDYGPDKLTEYAECAKDHFPILSCNCNAHSHEGVKNNIKKWTISTYKCSRQSLYERLGKTSKTVDPELEEQIEALRDTQRKYSNILRLAKTLSGHFFNMVQTQVLLFFM